MRQGSQQLPGHGNDRLVAQVLQGEIDQVEVDALEQELARVNEALSRERRVKPDRPGGTERSTLIKPGHGLLLTDICETGLVLGRAGISGGACFVC